MRTTPTGNRRPATAVLSVVSVAALVLVAGACSDDDAASPTGSGQPPTASVAASTAPPTSAPVTEPSAPVTEPTATSGPVGTVGSTVPTGPTGPACGQYPTEGPGSPDVMSAGSTAAAIAGNPVLSTLAMALDAAGLAETLDGPVTVFAPSNDAFDALASDELDALLADPDGALTALLARHVIDGADLDTTSLLDAGSVEGLGGTLGVALDGDGLLVDAGGGPARLACGDITTTNGVIHVVDTVLLPPPADTQAVGGSQLFTVDLATGTASPLGGFGAERGVLGIAVAPDATTLYGVTDAAELISFSPDDPSATTTVAITGVEGTTLLALDIDPDSGALLALSDSSVLFSIDPASGTATPVGAPLDPAIDDPGFGFDIDPADGLARLLVTTGTNLRIDVDTGAVATDGATGAPEIGTAAAFATGDANEAATPRVVAAAFGAPDGGAPVLYTVDAATGSLGRIDSPADGVVTTIGGLGVILSDGASLDISASGVAYLTVPG